MLVLAVVAGICTAIQAQMYDYHRTAYATFAIKGALACRCVGALVRGWLGRLVAAYSASQRALLGEHGTVEQLIASRAIGGVVRLDDREKYRACFYWPVRGWNVLGDNVRRFAIAAFVLLHHLEWFVVFTLVPMNLIVAGALDSISAVPTADSLRAVEQETCACYRASSSLRGCSSRETVISADSDAHVGHETTK